MTHPVSPAGEHSWFAIQTNARHEKRVAAELEERSVVAFLPLCSELHQWSDPKRQVDLPLFGTYVFVRIGEEQGSRIKVLQMNSVVLQMNSVLRFVGDRGMGSSIPDEQIESLQTIIREKVPFRSIRLSMLAKRSESAGGAWTVFVGSSQEINNDRSLVVSVESIQRSLAHPNRRLWWSRSSGEVVTCKPKTLGLPSEQIR